MAPGAEVPISQEAIDRLLRSEANGDEHIPHIILVIPTKEYAITGSLREGQLTITRKEKPDASATKGERRSEPDP